MPRHIAFLRAINVGGRIVKMEVLRAHFEALGLACVETFLASGNVIFEMPGKGVAQLPAKIEARLLAALGFEVQAFLRTGAELAAIANYAPFAAADVEAAPTLCVGFLAEPLDRQAEARLLQFRSAIDDFRSHGREVYWLCRKKQSESTFTNAVFERALKLRTTFRGIGTVRRLVAKYPPE
jgi:uncharacterized protein (DUF1697 family)